MDKKISLDTLITLRLLGADLAYATEDMLLKANMRLIGQPEPNPTLAYTNEITRLLFDACKDYKPEEVEERLRKHAPYLFKSR